MSDAANILVYMGIPKDIVTKKKSLKLSKIGILMNSQYNNLLKEKKTGVFWHIYAGKDMEKIQKIL